MYSGTSKISEKSRWALVFVGLLNSCLLHSTDIKAALGTKVLIRENGELYIIKVRDCDCVDQATDKATLPSSGANL